MLRHVQFLPRDKFRILGTLALPEQPIISDILIMMN